MGFLVSPSPPSAFYPAFPPRPGGEFLLWPSCCARSLLPRDVSGDPASDWGRWCGGVSSQREASARKPGRRNTGARNLVGMCGMRGYKRNIRISSSMMIMIMSSSASSSSWSSWSSHLLGGRAVLEMAWFLVFSILFCSCFFFLCVCVRGGVDICRWHTNHNDIHIYIYCILIGCTHLFAAENNGTWQDSIIQ